MASSQGIRAGRAYVEIGASDKLQAGLRAAQARLKAFGASVTAVGTKLAAIGGIVLAGLGVAVKKFAEVGDQYDKMSQRTGLTAEELSELAFAAEQSGSDIEALEKVIRRMATTIYDAARGSALAVDALADLGLSVDFLMGLRPAEQLSAIADALASIEDPSRRSAIALAILGKSGASLLPLLQTGSRGIAELREEARALGLTISQKTATDAAKLTDAINRLRKVLTVSLVTIGSVFGPALEAASNTAARLAKGLNDIIDRNRGLVRALGIGAAVIFGVGTALLALGLTVTIAGIALGGLATAIGVATSVASGLLAVIGAIFTPIGALTILIGTLGVTLVRKTQAGADSLDYLARKFSELRDTATRVFEGIADALAVGDIALAAEILWLGVKVAWYEGTEDIERILIQFKYSTLKLVEQTMAATLSAFEFGWHGIKVAFIETVAFLSTAWTKFVSGFETAWVKASRIVADGLLEAQGLLDDSFDVETAKQETKRQADQRLDDIEKSKTKSLEDIESERQKRRDEESARSEKRLEKIIEDLERAEKDLDDVSQSKIDAAKKALEDAKKELDESIRRARENREAADAKRNEQKEKLDRAGEQTGEKSDVRGIFNARAIQSLRTNSVTDQRLLSASQKTAANTEKIARAVANGRRLVFA